MGTGAPPAVVEETWGKSRQGSWSYTSWWPWPELKDGPRGFEEGIGNV